jgi:hypothetical protein
MDQLLLKTLIRVELTWLLVPSFLVMSHFKVDRVMALRMLYDRVLGLRT